MNLLKETLEDIELNGKTPDDIVFIGAEHSGYSCTWKEFTILADIEYDNGYGGQEIAEDLIIVFNDGSRMHRHEYDGSEYWRCTQVFVFPKEPKSIKSLRVHERYDGWGG